MVYIPQFIKVCRIWSNRLNPVQVAANFLLLSYWRYTPLYHNEDHHPPRCLPRLLHPRQKDNLCYPSVRNRRLKCYLPIVHSLCSPSPKLLRTLKCFLPEKKDLWFVRYFPAMDFLHCYRQQKKQRKDEQNRLYSFHRLLLFIVALLFCRSYNRSYQETAAFYVSRQAIYTGIFAASLFAFPSPRTRKLWQFLPGLIRLLQGNNNLVS